MGIELQAAFGKIWIISNLFIEEVLKHIVKYRYLGNYKKKPIRSPTERTHLIF